MRSYFARALTILVVLPLLAPLAPSQSTVRVSVDSSGSQANGSSSAARLAADGRYVVFLSSATNLVAGDGNGAQDVFLRDTLLGTTQRVSVDNAGSSANNNSFSPAISADGRIVAFSSDATNLASVDTNSARDIFVHDVLTGTTSRASVSASGAQANGASHEPAVSGDGRFVAYLSSATNLVIGDINGKQDVFLRDLVTGAVTRASVDSSGTQANESSSAVALSGDGSYVVFASAAANLVPSDTNSVDDIFVYDRINALTTRVNVSSTGAQTTSGSPSFSPQVSASGRFVLFASTAPNLVLGDSNFALDIFLRDTLTLTTQRVSLSHTGAEVSGTGGSARISADGGSVAFATTGAVLPGGNASQHVYVRQLFSSSIVRVSAASGGLPANSDNFVGGMSGDGSLVAYESTASNLVAGDSNAASDVFLGDLTSIWAVVCPGDGSATPCPCGNNSLLGARSGCINSTGLGARLDASGNPSISADTFVLTGSQMTNGTCLYIQGTAALNTGLGVVLGDGLRCAGGSVIRLAIKVNSAGASQYPSAGDPLISVSGMCLPGVVQTYQVWHRDGANYCAPERYNLSNGLSLTWRP